MFDRTYQPGGSFTPVGMTLTCVEPACPSTATHERDGHPLCFDHFMLALQREQPQVECEDVA